MYSAKSIIAALKANEELECEGIDSLGCPSPTPHYGCNGDPDSCDLCKSQSCKQSISVHLNFKKLILLNFRYMVSIGNRDGFIRKDDSALNKLINHKFINKEILKLAV